MRPRLLRGRTDQFGCSVCCGSTGPPRTQTPGLRTRAWWSGQFGEPLTLEPTRNSFNSLPGASRLATEQSTRLSPKLPQQTVGREGKFLTGRTLWLIGPGCPIRNHWMLVAASRQKEHAYFRLVQRTRLCWELAAGKGPRRPFLAREWYTKLLEAIGHRSTACSGHPGSQHAKCVIAV